ncbi:hypothetical protein LguiA_010901 [Lonicera macranthoides]
MNEDKAYKKEEEAHCNLNSDDQPMKIEALTPIKCIDLNAGGCDKGLYRNAGGSDKGLNIENIIDLNIDNGDEGVNIENFIDLNSDSGDDGINDFQNRLSRIDLTKGISCIGMHLEPMFVDRVNE